VAIVWRVEDEAERVLQARRVFRERLVAIAGPSQDVDDAELIYGELVANTVRYAHEGAVEAALEVHDSDPAVLVVRDHGPGLRACPWTPHRDPYAESGRGLGLVELLARDVEVDTPDGGGTVIRATLPVIPRQRFAA
jgi:anti-sigma regulatory factor (Ser/Thr protein kinase)